MPLPIQHFNSAMTAKTKIINKDMIMERFDDYRQAISFYRAYPDKLVDLYIEASEEDCSFRLYPYQRIFLRAMARYKDVYLTFSRGTSKSFSNELWAILQCILYPNTRLAVVATAKQQSAAIVEKNISEILNLLPILKFEIKKQVKVKDQYTVMFKNGSIIQNLAAKATSRGLRFSTLTIEEVIESAPDIIQEVILPTLAIQRRAANGMFDPDEVIAQQRVCITTAGYRGTYAHHLLMKTLVRQLTQPGKAIILGGSYKIPILAGLQNMDYIRQQQMSGEFSPTSFSREYLSKWSSGSEQSFFSGPVIEKYRVLQEPMFERSDAKTNRGGFVMSIDVGRFSDQSEITIWRYVPQKGTVSTKYLVNIISLEQMHFTQQAIEIKIQYNKYLPERVVIDGNGLGAGLIDELIQGQVDARTGQYLQPWGVYNDEKAYYNQFKTDDTIPNVLYIIKANAVFNTQMYTNFQTQLTTGKLRFLTTEAQGKLKLETSRARKFQNMTDDEKADWLVPYIQTTLLQEQMVNLEEKREGINVILDRSNAKIKKDKVSAAGYGLWYIKTEIDDVAMRTAQFGLNMMFSGTPMRGNKRSIQVTFNGNRHYGHTKMFQ